MNTKDALMTTTLGLIAVIAIGTMTQLDNAFAETSNGYKMADGVEAIFTFTFKDGVEIHNFPVFKMGESIVDDAGVSFNVEGIIGESPHLHKALDEAYKYRMQTAASFNYDYRYFDVDVSFVKDGNTITALDYHDCTIENYSVDTLNDDYESYLSSKTGFAVVDIIDFECGGLNPHLTEESTTWKTSSIRETTEYAHLDYKYASDVKTFVTFDFDTGIEKIEFPYFEITSGFGESTDAVAAQFSVEGVVAHYPLLFEAIDNARVLAGTTYASNTDFDALVEFTQDGEVLRALDYRDCTVESAKITTLLDKEEGFTGKSGFALVNDIDFQCSGLAPINDKYMELYGDAPIWKISTLSNEQPNHEFPTTGDVHAVATFTFANGQEVVDFPNFDQGNILGLRAVDNNDKFSSGEGAGEKFVSRQFSSIPTFELAGIVGNTPLLYDTVDKNLKLQGNTGSHQNLDLFSVDIDLVVGGEVVRGFNYNECRVTDYVVQSQRDKEESYFKGFALSNTFDFECQGYHPNNPIYDAMHEVDAGKNISSMDLRDTQDWDRGFYVQ